MNSKKPRIVVTGPNEGGTTAWVFTAFNIMWAGGVPLRVRPKDGDQIIDFDGVVIGGGSDIHPDNIEEEPLPKVKRSWLLKLKEGILYPLEAISRLSKPTHDEARDEMEQAYIRHALKNKKPILGICRGHQLLNSTLGGSMYTSTLPLLKDEPRIRSPFPRKKVIYVQSDSLIAKIAGDDPIKVNAIHSQAIAKPGEGLEITAKEKAGINQVVESEKSDKVIGVQWHPEYLFYMRGHRRIFRWLIEETK